MAVDTLQKRFSMLNFGIGPTWWILFEADGSVDLDDRQHLLDCYSGIAFGPPPPTTFTTFGRVSVDSDIIGRIGVANDTVGRISVDGDDVGRVS